MSTAQRPDFAGDFALNRQACTLEGGAASVRSATLRIEQRGPDVRIEASFNVESTSRDFTLEAASLRWDGDALVFTHKSDAPDAPMDMTWRYELDDDGHRLTATERIRGEGRDQDNVWVFDRREQR
jgi:hypothetical protein